MVMNRIGRGAMRSTTHFGIEAERVVDELERHLRHCRWIVAPRRRAQFGRLAVRQQHVVAVGKLGVAGERALDTVRGGALQQIMVLVRAAHAAHPACPVADADHRNHAFDPRIDGGDEHHGRAAVAGAVDAEAGRVHLGLRAHEGQRRLHVGDAAIGRQTGFRPVAVAPALVVEGQHNVAGLGEDARVVRQIDAAHAGIAVTQHDAGAPLAGLDVRRQEQIARELDALAVEGHGLQHRSPRRRARDSFGSHAVFVGSGK